MKKRNHLGRSNGFTIVELLVVVMIISMLALLVIVNLDKSKEKSRDAQRKQDLSLISSALDTYYADNKAYPIVSSFTDISTCLDDLATDNYINSLPTDPLSGSYKYRSDTTGSQYKVISESPETIEGLSGTCSDTQLQKLAGDFCDPVVITRFQISSSNTALSW